MHYPHAPAATSTTTTSSWPSPPPPFLALANLSKSFLLEASLVAIVVSSCALLVLLALAALLAAARNDKAVRSAGVSFLAYLLVGGICGQGFLLSHALETHRLALTLSSAAAAALTDHETTWLDCHAQASLLILHLMLFTAPLMAKLWRVWSKIRTAETHQLQLWDATARRIARLQCGTTALLLAVHLSYSASEDYRGNAPRDTCLGESAPVHEVERALYTAETLLVLACLLPSPVCSRGRLTLLRPCPCTHTRVRVRVPPHAHGVRTALAAQVLAWAVTSSSFAPIFAAWPYLLLSVLAVLLCAAIQGTTFYVEHTNPLIKLGARQGGVHALTVVILWAWLLPALKPRLVPRRRSKVDLVREDQQLGRRHHRAGLQRQLKLQEYLARLMGERLREHEHRLSSLQLRLTLLNTPRQAGFLRCRAASAHTCEGPFDTYWAELRRDKRVYFFAHTAAQGAMPLFALELGRIERAAIVEVRRRMRAHASLHAFTPRARPHRSARRSSRCAWACPCACAHGHGHVATWS